MCHCSNNGDKLAPDKFSTLSALSSPDSICIGQHNHPRPQSNITKAIVPVVEEGPDKPCVANVEGEDKALNEHESVPQRMKSSHILQITNVPAADLAKSAHSKLTSAFHACGRGDYVGELGLCFQCSAIRISCYTIKLVLSLRASFLRDGKGKEHGGRDSTAVRICLSHRASDNPRRQQWLHSQRRLYDDDD
ncbi:hypothetical protein PIB30_046961 [Stylosanthes scabra]|uniref:Uncharacterized protein n=1 Tax=Stylosanthes scabra TaxID=79078 RepID=A0ABU6SGG9_9FABA|nr:hypothetical protein [Stylosanthes scabra]